MYAQHIIDANCANINQAQAAVDLAAAQDDWEADLDAMGTEASLADYEAHLAKAPIEGAEMTNYLKGVIAARSQPF